MKFSTKNLPILFTSHDIDFIDHIAEVIFFLDSKGVEKTKEKCSRYLESRKQKIEHAFAEYEIALRRQRELLESARAAKQHAEAGAKWKSPDNDKYVQGFNRDKAAKSGGLGRRLEERAESIDVKRPRYDPLARVTLSSEKRKGHLCTLNTTAFNKSRVSLSLESGDKVLLTGKNGAGKTTLLNHLVELLSGAKPLTDEQFSRSGNFSFLYLTQDWYEHLSSETVSDYLVQFGLGVEEQYQSIAYNTLDTHILQKKFQDLSPGVRVKVLLGALSFRKYDLIIWDEPTNHLDVMIQKILLEAFVGMREGCSSSHTISFWLAHFSKGEINFLRLWCKVGIEPTSH